jgi:hypothetical protein
MMDSESKMLALEEFVSLLVVGNGCAITDLPSVIPAEHSARLIALVATDRKSANRQHTDCVRRTRAAPTASANRLAGEMALDCSVTSRDIGDSCEPTAICVAVR